MNARMSDSNAVPERTWLRPLLTPWTRRIALAALGISFVFPITGLGVDLCPVHRLTGLPCPGCGMSRAVSLVSQGHLDLALGAHPFVIFVWPLLLVLGGLALFPGARVLGWERRLDVLEPFLSRAARVLIAAFFGFGVLRFVAFLVLRESFP